MTGEAIHEGTGDMRAYQGALYGNSMGDGKFLRRIENELRNYCKFDTLAMVIIWEHWRTRLELG